MEPIENCALISTVVTAHMGENVNLSTDVHFAINSGMGLSTAGRQQKEIQHQLRIIVESYLITLGGKSTKRTNLVEERTRKVQGGHVECM